MILLHLQTKLYLQNLHTRFEAKIRAPQKCPEFVGPASRARHPSLSYASDPSACIEGNVVCIQKPNMARE